MATTSKVLFRGAAATSSATLYTTPSATTTIVTNILVTNTAGSAGTYDLLLNDVSMANDVPVAANDTVSIDMKQVLEATHTIKGLASATTINFHICGVEIA
jgi:hypothetical protein